MKRNRNPFGLAPRELRLLGRVAALCGASVEVAALTLRSEQEEHEAQGLTPVSENKLTAALGRIAATIQLKK